MTRSPTFVGPDTIFGMNWALLYHFFFFFFDKALIEFQNLNHLVVMAVFPVVVVHTCRIY